MFVNNQSGDDARDGTTAEQAVRTLDRAVGLCSAGDTLHISNTGSEYRESLNLGARSGTPSAPIIVEGNGAVLSGLTPLSPDLWQDRGNGRYFFPSVIRRQMPAARPYVLWNKKLVPQKKSVTEIAVEECCWDNEGIYFLVASGKSIADYHLESTGRISGLILAGGSYIEVRNLICERFANDGFNVHGSCQGLVFRNITGRWNGDDGFSMHEDAGAVVLGGHFHHNDYGIQDINISRSSFYGVLVESNRRAGVDVYGGVRTFFDSVVRNNAGPQIQLAQDRTMHMRSTTDGPATDGVLILRNTLTLGGDYGIAIRGGRADISNCTIVGAKEGILIGPDAEAEMIGNAIYGCTEQELVCRSTNSVLNANLYVPGRVSWQGQSYTPETFTEYQKVSGQDPDTAAMALPILARAEGFRLSGQGLSYGRYHLQPGITAELSFPFGSPIRNTLEGVPVADESELSFDFEFSNPWGLVYPWPEKNLEGQAAAGTATLSDEQQLSGKRSLKLDVTFPTGRPGPWLVKLFSARLSVAKPVTEMRFAIFGDDSGLIYQPRIRDCSGESFYGPTGRVDWQGWREIAWSLAETAPVLISSGDGNRRLDGPEMEFILELKPEIPAEGGHLVLYLDNLTIRLKE